LEGISAGPGIYAREIILTLPYLPIIDEAQLDQADTRDSFLERVFSLARWHHSNTTPMSISRLMDFHKIHYLTLAARGCKAYKVLSDYITDRHEPLSRQALDHYLVQLHNQLEKPLSFRDHVGMLIKLKQRLLPTITSEENDQLNTAILEYRENQEGLKTPLQLIKQLADTYNLNDLSRQTYISPMPAETALRYGQQ
jgi:uncharacterized protein YbgA (DUF1722 family)